MTTKYPCSIEFSDSGHFMRIIHKTGFIIGEFIVNDTNLMNRSQAAYDRLGKIGDIPLRNRNPLAIYRGEVNEMVETDIIQDEIDSLRDMLSEFDRYKRYLTEEENLEIAKKMIEEDIE